MKKLTLSPESDFALSQIVLGLWRLNDIPTQQITDLLHFAIDQGITSIDEADIYGGYRSQEYMGRALKAEPSLRDKIEIVTKAGIVLPGSKFTKSGIGYYKTTDTHITQSVEQSLAGMHTSYIDLLLIHRPDALMIPEELDDTFQKLKKSGKVLHFGVSNFTPSQFEMLSARMKTPLLTNQVEFSVLNTTPVFDGTLDHCMKNRMKPMIWSPLAGGALFTQKTEQIHRVTGILAEIALEHNNAGIDQIALAWILKHPVNALIISGTLKTDRIREAVESLSIDLTEEQWYRILIASQGHPMA
jgi:predicted oxidoreductase